MDKLIIKGGQKLNGEVVVSGAKNAALPILISTILAPGINEISNVPFLKDIDTTIKMLELLGVDSARENNRITLDTANITSHEATYDLVKTMRASILVLGPLLARFGESRVSLPGGCAIGARPIDLHLVGLKALGAEIEIESGYVKAKASKLLGSRIVFDFPTVGGTEQIMMTAALINGESVIENAAREPEIVDLAEALVKMGAKIEGAGTNTIFIQGTNELHPIEHRIIPDRIEAGTLMIAAAITGGNIIIHDANLQHLDSLVFKLQDCGAEIFRKDGAVNVIGPESIEPVNMKTRPYPGFPTDMQAQLMALLVFAKGTSVISENIFENRFMHVAELRRLGADITIEGSSAIVRGVGELSGAPVMATDLRASASLVLAGLAAHGVTEVSRIYHLDRGYDSLEKKLASLGADIQRI